MADEVEKRNPPPLANAAADADPVDPNASARERILTAAGELFSETGFDATPTSRIAERADVPKGLIHYYFRRKHDLLTALVERMPEETIDSDAVVIRGDLVGSLRRLIRELDRRLESSPLLSHLLWREADTHVVVQRAMRARFQDVVAQIRQVIDAAMPTAPRRDDVESAAVLLARAVNHRHSVARHGEHDDELEREVGFVAHALELGARRA
jgi:AcrR family transcriptional regulator